MKHQTGFSWIGGRWATSTHRAFQGENPRLSEALEPVFHEASLPEVDEAFAEAEACFDLYRTLPAERRAALLREFAREVELAKTALIELAAEETGLPESKLEAEWKRVRQQAELFAELIEQGEWQRPILDLGDASRQPQPKPDIRQNLQALGPVVVFGASNFPLAISVGGTDTVSALAAGCPVVVKAHPAHPATSEAVAYCVIRAVAHCGLPAGIFSMIQGDSHEIGAALVQHELACAVAFTGSTRGGRALFNLAHQREIPIPFYGELGSINPVFVLPEKLEADAAGFAKAFVSSLTMGVGQYCTNPGIVVLASPNGVEAFYESLKQAMELHPAQTLLHRGIYKSFVEGVDRLNQTPGVQWVAKGLSETEPKANQAVAQVFATSAASFLTQRELHEEVFGPMSLVVVCENEAELLQVARSFQGQLTASVHGLAEELKRCGPLLRVLEKRVGRIIFDGFGTGIEICEAMHHGGPYPASTHATYTSIGHQSIYRFVKPVCYQNAPDGLLPPALQTYNPLGLRRRENGSWTPPS